MDDIDNRLLNLIQKEFEITEYPFNIFSKKLGINSQEVIERLEDLKKLGYIRRMGGVFDSRKLGYLSTLLAMEVSEEIFYEVADIINSFDEVTHNYRRNNKLNMWFTLVAKDENYKKEILEKIKKLTNIDNIYEFPSKRFFKLNVFFNMEKR